MVQNDEDNCVEDPAVIVILEDTRMMLIQQSENGIRRSIGVCLPDPLFAKLEILAVSDNLGERARTQHIHAEAP